LRQAAAVRWISGQAALLATADERARDTLRLLGAAADAESAPGARRALQARAPLARARGACGMRTVPEMDSPAVGARLSVCTHAPHY
jgi:hypothetical protein